MRLLNLSMSQLLWVFFATNLLNKLKPNRLFLRWLASYGLKHYRAPTDEELKRIQYSKKQKKSDSKKNQHKPITKSAAGDPNDPPQCRPGEFQIRCSDLAKINLNKVDVDLNFLTSAPYSEELEWVVDFAFMSLVSFLLTQTLFYFSPETNEYNFSLVWVFLVILQSLRILSQLTAIYFRTKLTSGERSVCLVSALFFFILAIVLLNISDDHLELGVDQTLRLLSEGSTTVHRPNKYSLLDLDQIELPPNSPRSIMTLCIKLVVALICSFVGVILTFPGFRFGNMHESIISSDSTTNLQRILYNINLISPFLASCLWVPTISRQALKKQQFIPINDDQFEAIRICTLILLNVLHIILMRRYIAAFLESAKELRFAKIIRRGGFTSNRFIQAMTSNQNSFTNVACIQYILPTIICLFSTIMFASLTLNFSNDSWDSDSYHSSKRFAGLKFLFGPGDEYPEQQAMINAAEEFVDRIRRLLSSDLVRNTMGFFTWWAHFAWTCTSFLGLGYHKYFKPLVVAG